MEFLLQDDHRYDNSVLPLLMRNWRYIVVLPFVATFGKFVAAKYKINWLAGAAVALAAFAVSVEGYSYFDTRLRTSIADNSDCHERMVDQVAKEYRPEVLAKQITILLNNELRPDYLVSPAGTDFMFSAPGEVPDGKFNTTQIRSFFKE